MPKIQLLVHHVGNFSLNLSIAWVLECNEDGEAYEFRSHDTKYVLWKKGGL